MNNPYKTNFISFLLIIGFSISAKSVFGNPTFADYLHKLGLFEDAGFEFLADSSTERNLLTSARSFRQANDFNNYFKIIDIIIVNSINYEIKKEAITDIKDLAQCSGDTLILAYLYNKYPEIDSSIVFIRRGKWEEIGITKRGKSPVFAEIVSLFIPGSGQILSGNYFEGLRSFTVNSALWFVVISGFIDKFYPRSIVVYYFFGNRYWIGGAVRAGEIAKNKNENELARSLKMNCQKGEEQLSMRPVNYDLTNIFPALPDTISRGHSENAPACVFRGLIKVYQDFLSDLDAHECPMTPSCSEFAMRAFQKTNPLQALFLTADRLMRDNSFAKRYYQKDKNNKLIDDVDKYLK